MKVQEYYFTLACLFMEIWMYLVCHQLFKQPTLKVVNKTEFHASYAECRGGDTQHNIRKGCAAQWLVVRRPINA